MMQGSSSSKETRGKKGGEAEQRGRDMCAHIVKPYAVATGEEEEKGETCDVSEAGNQLRQTARENYLQLHTTALSLV